MDAEKQSFDSIHKSDYPSAAASHSSLKYLRAAQHIFATVAISFIACAIDRNILMPGVTAEEKALLASSIFTFLVLIYHIVAPYKRTATLMLDGLTAAFLFATFVYGAVQADNNGGACAGPKKIGVWANHRGCERMSVATGFTAVGFATFTASTIVAALK
ncbi:hypothetical protein DE146DRAFT_666106 [Phaeosphaeria sp. MPI-PUGE-AT-0046c]|nr:hypothetical protein DE146DRAFT_666106 [Phaeosphaeria sp. MPI-PUGE-AT-0046c]